MRPGNGNKSSYAAERCALWRHSRVNLVFSTKYPSRLLGRKDSARGAHFGAGATFDAGVGVNLVDIAFRDSFHRAVGQAGATSYTVVCDYVSHNCSFY